MKYRKVLLLFATVLLAACSVNSGNPPEQKQANETVVQVARENAAAKKQQLLFFINPNGRPCQIQNSILDEISGKVSEKSELVYVSTTDPAAREIFYKYGVRSLPNLILADQAGNVVKRFPPGIQESQVILSALGY